ncbi:hypothetical protein QE152_g27182 [Popillia japonica]|uniref:Uncharacterized protein n=1 Tax=Popillia japonica TaxID=7064 RepID=A0AAW1JVJ3_POPJA
MCCCMHRDVTLSHSVRRTNLVTRRYDPYNSNMECTYSTSKNDFPPVLTILAIDFRIFAPSGILRSGVREEFAENRWLESSPAWSAGSIKKRKSQWKWDSGIGDLRSGFSRDEIAFYPL